MTRFDPSQERVLGLDPAGHARVLGAPGSGKTLLLVESYARILERPGWGEGDVLVLAPNRLVAGELRRRIEGRLSAPLGGSPARTATAFAFAVLRRAAALAGRTPPRLLTGTAHDEVVAEVVAEWIDASAAAPGVAADAARLPFAPEVLASPAFRAELRELARVCDDFAAPPAELRGRLRAAAAERAGDAHTRAPSADLAAQWDAALALLTAVDARLASDRPGELPASALLRAACAALADAAAPAPRLVLVDDAQEVGEGELALLAALARRGARVWAFGDPDTATGAFHGERTRLLAGIEAELARRGAPAPPGGEPEQPVVLERVHRHGVEIRGFVRGVTERIGAVGAGAQRAAAPMSPGAGRDRSDPSAVCFAAVATTAEQLGTVAHRLRRRRLGLDGRPAVGWGDMAVICRSRGEATRAARVLAGHQVPTSVAAGGIVLREHQLVRELIRLLQHALGIAEVRGAEVAALLGGTVGGLDPIALRRLRAALRLRETREARQQDRDPVPTEQLILEGFAMPGGDPLVDSRGGRQLRRLGRLAAAAAAVRERGGTARETLWAVWEGTGLAERLQEEALAGRGARADEAHRMLDAAMGLFFALQRHEEQASRQPVDELLEELLASAVPEDSLAGRSERDVVTVTTPQGAIGREFSVVCLLGPQDGSWPDLRSRGMLLGVTALERWLRGDAAEPPARRDTLHDELRLFAQACSRARDELLAVAVADDEHHPSSFHGLGRAHAPTEPLPSSRLTLRGAVAEMRRRLAGDPDDAEALASLVELARAGAPGAHPDEWYGAIPPSTTGPLVDLGDPESVVHVSPSQIEAAERCPLSWAVSRLGGGEARLAASIGTLLHRAFELAGSANAGALDADELMRVVEEHWGALTFEAGWQEDQQRAEVRGMAEGLAGYLRAFAASGGELLGTELGFSLRVGRAEIGGTADRLEVRTNEAGERLVSVLDLKTGRRAPSAAERETHAQLQAYQLGVIEGALHPGGAGADGAPTEPGELRNGGARLLYVHPNALNKTGPRYLEAQQAPLSEEGAAAFRDRVAAVAEIMAAGAFVANVEHHCDNPYAVGTACRIHVVPAVSHA